MNENKINKSFLTEEAKDDINDLLGRGGDSGGGSFVTQIETTEGITLGKGTEIEESLAANEISYMKDNIGKLFSGLAILSNVSIDTSAKIVTFENVDITLDGTTISDSDTIKCVSASGFAAPDGSAIALPAFPFNLTIIDDHTVRANKLLLLTFGTSSGNVGGAISFIFSKN